MKNRVYINRIDNEFKIDVFYMNYRDVMKVLLNKKTIYQIIRFAFSESFTLFEKNLISKFLTIHKHCPNLLNTLLLYFKRSENE